MKLTYIAETVNVAENDLYLDMTSRLCYYGEQNANGYLLPVESAEDKAQTLIGMPVVAKYKSDGGKPDLGGHEMIKIGDKTLIGTKEIGAHLTVEIKDDTVEIDGEEKTLPCLFATSRIWRRHNENIIAAINRLQSENRLYTSWEILVLDSEESEDGVITVKDYQFEANCLLGSKHIPAYGEASKVLNVAEAEEDIIGTAALKDTDSEKEGEDDMSKVKTASLTSDDIRLKIDEKLKRGWVALLFPEEHYVLVKSWDMDSLEFDKVTYSVDENDEVTIGKPERIKLVVPIEAVNTTIKEKDREIGEKNDALVSCSQTIAELKGCKEKLEKLQAQQREKELAQKRTAMSEYAVQSGYISAEELTGNEEIKRCISEADESGLKSIIADRLMASKPKTVGKIAVSAIADDDEVIDYRSVIKRYVGRE